jgi:hypothetical protein
MRSVLAANTRSASRLAFLVVLAATAFAPPVAAQKWYDPFGWSKDSSSDEEEKKPEENDIPFGPIDEKGRAVERTDLDPVVGPDGAPHQVPDAAPVSYELWRGLTLTAFADAIGKLELPPRSPTLANLWKKLITSNVTVPAGAEGAAQFTALRAEALSMSGLPDAAARTLAGAAAQGADPRIAVLAAQTQIELGHRDEGCETAKRFLAAEGQIPKGLQTEAIIIGGYCAAARGDATAASLQAGLAREINDGSVSADILDAVANGAEPHMPKDGKLTLLDYRIAQLKGGFQEKLKVANAPASILAVLARDASTAAELRLAAGEKAASINVITPEDLGALYRSVEAAGDAEAIERVTLFKTAEAERTPLKKARLIRSFLDAARRAGLYWPALKLMDKPALTLQPVAEIGWFAETAVEVHLASGNFERARTWAQFGSSLDAPPDEAGPRSGNLAHWMALIDIADPSVKTGHEEHLKSVEEMAIGGQFDGGALYRLATALDALDINVPIPLWDVANRTPQPAGGHLPDTGVLTELGDASKKKEFGRTVVLAMRTIGSDGVEKAHIIALGDTIRALKRAGLEPEARQLALEGVFSSWPRSAGH